MKIIENIENYISFLKTRPPELIWKNRKKIEELREENSREHWAVYHEVGDRYSATEKGIEELKDAIKNPRKYYPWLSQGSNATIEDARKAWTKKLKMMSQILCLSKEDMKRQYEYIDNITKPWNEKERMLRDKIPKFILGVLEDLESYSEGFFTDDSIIKFYNLIVRLIKIGE